ncbi:MULTISPECIES: hypothetical protein [Haloferax]|uniref:Uncharacterized protein n=1 Tax=Haloferax marinum TaxID=2666143 RepID=A0A6A8G7G6_9EURY|nr:MULTISPECIES: hypothetical protein [Haloferax]KAB1198011.1 hypothetical protein Hfx1150_10965 [Haloferax sp. CBA1150]MRW97079.1 hypothetical protein [Haloferax marinum]
MSLRTVVEDSAFRTLLGAGIGIGVLTLVVTYVQTGQIDVVSLVLFVALVALFGALLVTYWDYMEQRAETE